MRDMTAELATASTHLDLNLHLQVDDRRTEELAGPEEVIQEPAVIICGM